MTLWMREALRRNQACDLMRFPLAISDLKSSYEKQGKADLGFNLCLSCLEKRFLTLKGGVDLVAFGLCRDCGSINRVCDFGLLSFYTEAGFTADQIKKYLPLLRQSTPMRHRLGLNAILEAVEYALDCIKIENDAFGRSAV